MARVVPIYWGLTGSCSMFRDPKEKGIETDGIDDDYQEI